jgi:hypothetical protein
VEGLLLMVMVELMLPPISQIDPFCTAWRDMTGAVLPDGGLGGVLVGSKEDGGAHGELQVRVRKQTRGVCGGGERVWFRGRC